MNVINRPFWVVRYLPNQAVMPLLRGFSSWWIPTNIHADNHPRLFDTRAKAAAALGAWRKGGLTKSCPLRDMTREEAIEYSPGYIGDGNLRDNWERFHSRQGLELLSDTEARFSGPVYIERLQVANWNATARQACMLLEVVPILISVG